MILTADLVCDAQASSCELFRVTFEHPSLLSFECHGNRGELRHLFAQGYCIGLIVEGMVAGLDAMLRGDLDHGVDFPLPKADSTAFFTRHFTRDIDGVVLTLESVPRHKRRLVCWIGVAGPYGLDITLRCTQQHTEAFLGQLELIRRCIPSSLGSSPGEWATNEAAKFLAQDADPTLRNRALKYLVDQTTSADLFAAANACEALGKSQCRTAERALRLALGHSEVMVRQTAATALGCSARQRSSGTLKRLLSDVDPLIRLGAVRGLALALGADSAPILAKAQKKERDGRVQAEIAGVLLAHGDSEARLILTELLNDNSSSVRAFAKSELRRAGITPGWDRP